MTYVGIDACSKGWIAVAMDVNGIAQDHFLSTIALVEPVIPDARVIAIDIPIGFPTTGHREADLSARAAGSVRVAVLCSSRRRSLYWEAENHAIATALAVKLTGQGISRQSYGLRAKIFEVAQWVTGAPCPVHEAHPEVSFTRLMGAPAKHSKKTGAGMVERRGALDRAGIGLRDITRDAARYAAVDDMFDAAVPALGVVLPLWHRHQSSPSTSDSASFDIAIVAIRISSWADLRSNLDRDNCLSDR